MIYLPLLAWLWKAPYGPRFRKEPPPPPRAVRGLADVAATVRDVAGNRVIVSMILLAGCGPTSEVPSTQQIASAVANALPPETAQNIQNQIGQLLAVPMESIQLQQVEKKDWPDGCLGLPQPDEVCTQAVTPGWLLVFSVNGQEFRFRANDQDAALFIALANTAHGKMCSKSCTD
jgi:hypothetical protein